MIKGVRTGVDPGERHIPLNDKKMGHAICQESIRVFLSGVGVGSWPLKKAKISKLQIVRTRMVPVTIQR